MSNTLQNNFDVLQHVDGCVYILKLSDEMRSRIQEQYNSVVVNFVDGEFRLNVSEDLNERDQSIPDYESGPEDQIITSSVGFARPVHIEPEVIPRIPISIPNVLGSNPGPSRFNSNLDQTGSGVMKTFLQYKMILQNHKFNPSKRNKMLIMDDFNNGQDYLVARVCNVFTRMGSNFEVQIKSKYESNPNIGGTIRSLPWDRWFQRADWKQKLFCLTDKNSSGLVVYNGPQDIRIADMNPEQRLTIQRMVESIPLITQSFLDH